ncbi:MAG: (2Fe-2S) ferredoxin domain-containing protein [Candidatus Aminicenantes bacterium]|nr:(2Fe-2S) ferredoxin domain-containing protein [Candidatus Aminicenantes bacterium]
MPKLKIEDLAKIKERTARTSQLRKGGPHKAKITVHMGTCGIASGARGIMDAVMKEIEERNITDIFLTNSGCAGLCSREPMITVEILEKPPIKYIELTPDKVKTIFEDHIVGGNVVQEYALAVGSERTV